jgi:hypothetical protein
MARLLVPTPLHWLELQYGALVEDQQILPQFCPDEIRVRLLVHEQRWVYKPPQASRPQQRRRKLDRILDRWEESDRPAAAGSGRGARGQQRGRPSQAKPRGSSPAGAPVLEDKPLPPGDHVPPECDGGVSGVDDGDPDSGESGDDVLWRVPEVELDPGVFGPDHDPDSDEEEEEPPGTGGDRGNDSGSGSDGPGSKERDVTMGEDEREASGSGQGPPPPLPALAEGQLLELSWIQFELAGAGATATCFGCSAEVRNTVRARFYYDSVFLRSGCLRCVEKFFGLKRIRLRFGILGRREFVSPDSWEDMSAAQQESILNILRPR